MTNSQDSLSRHGESEDNKTTVVEERFENLNMKESDNIDSFFTHVIGLVTQMRTHGEVLEERRIVEKLLRVLPVSFLLQQGIHIS